MKTWKREGGYLYCWVDGKRKRHHIHVWEQANGPIPDGYEIDHINGQRDDNRLENLRLVTRKENMQNAKQYSTNTSGVTGVSWSKSKSRWRAYLVSEYKQISLGYYADWFDAVCARKSADNRYGFHENHGRRYRKPIW